MKKKMLVIPVLLLTFALFSIPVMGAPATKIEGTLTTDTTPPEYDPDFPREVSHDTISHGRGTTAGTATLTIGQDIHGGDWDSEWISVVNLKKDPAEMVISSKVKLAFTGGTFEGVSIRKIIGYPPGPSSIIETHMVLRGTGDFRGQTLKHSDGTYYLIMPK